MYCAKRDAFIFYGEMLGELKLLDEPPLVDIEWKRNDVGRFKIPAVSTATWRNTNGLVRAFVVNMSGSEQTIRPRCFSKSEKTR